MRPIRNSTPVFGPAGRTGFLRGALLAVAVACGMAATAPSTKAADDGLAIADAWVRMIVPMRPAAGYFTLKNGSDTTRFLTGASSPACGMVMLHQSKVEKGVDAMVMVHRVAVPAHGSVTFAPRGFHLMCMKPAADMMKAGKSVPFTLSFQDGATLTGQFAVHVGAK